MNAPFRTPPLKPEPHKFTLDDIERMQDHRTAAGRRQVRTDRGGNHRHSHEGELHLELKEKLNRLLIGALSTAYGLIPDGTLRLSPDQRSRGGFLHLPQTPQGIRHARAGRAAGDRDRDRLCGDRSEPQGCRLSRAWRSRVLGDRSLDRSNPRPPARRRVAGAAADVIQRNPSVAAEFRNFRSRSPMPARPEPAQSSRIVRSLRSWRSCASRQRVAIGRASRRLTPIGSPVSSQ